MDTSIRATKHEARIALFIWCGWGLRHHGWNTTKVVTANGWCRRDSYGWHTTKLEAGVACNWCNYRLDGWAETAQTIATCCTSSGSAEDPDQGQDDYEYECALKRC